MQRLGGGSGRRPLPAGLFALFPRFEDFAQIISGTVVFEGRDLFVSHIYMAGRGDSRLLVREITWQDDWPVVKY